MKNTLIFVLLALPFLYACSDDDDESSDQQGIAISQADLLGEWRITRFIDDNADETADYATFILEFQANGILLISEGSTTAAAGWALSGDGKTLTFSVNDDVDTDAIDPDDELDELEDDPWIIRGQTDTTLDLLEKDDDPDDEVTLTRV